MLTKLGEAAQGWKPKAMPGGDPLSAIRGAWVALVGAEVARAAQPVAIQNDALIVITASSAWSHQLTFLEPEIVRGIRAMSEGRAIARLRFRVGAVRTGLRGVANATVARPRSNAGAHPAPPATNPAEALARFRKSVEKTRAAHACAGGRFCGQCSAAIERGTSCVPCAEEGRLKLEAECSRLLYDAPWLQPEDVIATLPGLDAGAYDGIRRRLLRSWWDEMALARKRYALPVRVAPDRPRLRKIASSYVLLETKIDPNRLEMDSPVRRNALGDLFEFIREVETDA
ncbi:MAG: hypothetical protein NVSMB5_17770 [Candidatus Velthaea sp.]